MPNVSHLMLTNGSAYVIPGLDECIPTEENKTIGFFSEPDPVDVVSRIIFEVFGINHITLLKKTRKPEICFPRQVHMSLTVLSGLSLAKSGGVFGKDHATALHAKKVVFDTLDTKYPRESYVKANRCFEKFKEFYPNISLSRV